MEAIKNNNNSQSVSSQIQTAIDDLSKLSKPNSTSHSPTATTAKTTSTATNKTISQIDSTLSSLNKIEQFPYSPEHRARPHSSSVSSSPSNHNLDLARSLGRFAPTSTHGTSLSNLYSPGGLVPNSLTHWNNVNALRNPYSTYGAHRSAQKAISSTKDSNNPRKKTYEDKMDKQRLEHILFSGDNSGPLNQQKERMRQKLERKKSQKSNCSQKKRQSLPNSHQSSNGFMGLNAAKKQKVVGDNGGYFMSELKSQNFKNGEKSTKHSHKKKSNHRNKNNKKSLSKHQRRRQSNKTNKHNKKQPKNRQKNSKKPQQSNNKKAVENKPKVTENNAIATKINHINAAYDSNNNNDKNDNKLSSSLATNVGEANNSLLDKQCDIFEQHPDEYFREHNIDELMQNKVKLETLQQVSGISLWRDKKELEPLLGAKSRNLKLHKNENPNLEVGNVRIESLDNMDEEMGMDVDDDPFVDNFVNVNDDNSDNENEGGLMMKKSNFSSNSNDSELEIFLDSNERELIRQNEPGYSAECNSQFGDYEDINSNVDLIKFEESLPTNANNNSSSEKRRSVVLDSSITDNVNGGFDEVTFDTKADHSPKKVKFVSEEDSDSNRDMFENMNVNETETATTNDKNAQNDNDKAGFCMNALNNVFKVAASQNIQKNLKEKEEEREKEDFEKVSQKVDVSATWAKIKNEVKNSQQKQEKQQNEKEKEKEKEKNKSTKNSKKNNKKTKSKKSKNKQKREKKQQQQQQKQSEKKKESKDKAEKEKSKMSQNESTNNNNNKNVVKTDEKEKVKESEKASVASPKSKEPNLNKSQSEKQMIVKPKKKRKKRKKKKVSQIMNGINVDNGSDDERMTVESSSTAPSSTQYQEETDNNNDDSGWITKGAKNRRDKDLANKNKKKNNVSSPASSKSSTKNTFSYNAVNDGSKNNKKSPKKHQSHSHSHSKKQSLPQPKKSKSSNHIIQNRRDRNKHRKERRRDRNDRNDRNRDNRINRQKSDSSLLKNKNKFPSSTIVVPIKHSKTIQTSMIFPQKHANNNNNSEASMKKHHFPALKSSQSLNHHKKNNNNNKRDKPPNINLSVLSPPRTISNKSTPTSTPLSVHSDNDYLHTQRGNARPTRPPITRLQPKKMEAINASMPQSPPPNSHNQSHNNHNVIYPKPPLITQRSAPLPQMVGTMDALSTTNSEISTQTQTMDINNNNNNEQHTQSPQPPPPPPMNGVNNSSLIATTPSAGTHVACYLDESGNYKETGLVLPDNIFPANLPPTSIPLGTFVPNPNANNNTAEIETDMHINAPSTPPQQITNADAMSVASPQTPLVALHPLMPPSVMGMASAFPILPNATIPGVALGAIPGAVPILLPMPQFTPEQIANLNKLNININENGISTSPSSASSPSKINASESVLKPKTASFKPAVSKPIKLEDIKEEDEDLEEDDMETLNDDENTEKNDKVEDDENNEKEAQIQSDATLSIKKTVCIKPKSRRECMETLKNDLIAEEIEDEWVEIKDLDSTIYPATLWCLHVKSFHAAPECSLKKLQESMSSALHCISS